MISAGHNLSPNYAERVSSAGIFLITVFLRVKNNPGIL